MAAKKKKDKKWVQKADIKEGAFSAKAKKAGMSTQEYADKVLSDPKADAKTKKQAQLAKTFAKMRKKKKK